MPRKRNRPASQSDDREHKPIPAGKPSSPGGAGSATEASAGGIDDVFWMMEPSGQLTYVSPSVVRLLGYTPEEILQQSFDELFTPSSAERARQILQQLVTSAGSSQLLDPLRVELEHVHRTGTVIWTETTCQTVPEPGGGVIIVGITRNITERKAAEQALQTRKRQMHEQNETLHRLISSGILFQADFDRALQEVTAICAELIQTERTSVWQYSKDYDAILCLNLFERSSARHSRGVRLPSAEFPSYTQSHREGEVIAADDVYADPRTADIPHSYWQENDIRSLLDAPVWIHNRIGGLLSFEATAQRRSWSEEEKRLAVTLATLLSLCFEYQERRQVEQDLQASETRYRDLFNVSPDLILVQEPATGKILDANQAVLDAFGYTRKEIGDITIQQLSEGHPPYSQDNAMAWIKAAIEQGPQRFEWHSRRRNGELFWIEVTLSCFDLGGDKRLLLHGRNITSRKEAQEELDKVRALLTTAVAQSPAGILIADAPDVKIRMANAAALGIRGLTDRQLTQISCGEHSLNWRIYLPDGVTPYPPEQLPLSRAVLEGAVSRNVEALIITEQGERRWILANAGPVYDRHLKITAGIVVFQDITDRKQAEQALRDSEEAFRAMMEQSPLSTQVLSLEGKVLQVNQAFTQLWGATADDLRHYNILEDQLLEANGILPLLRRAFVGERVTLPALEYDATKVVSHGQRRVVQADASAIRDANGNIRFVVLVHQDITDRVHAEQELRRVKNYLANVVNSMPSALVGVDSQGRITQWNRQAETMTGIQASRAVGEPMQKILPEFFPWIVAMRKKLSQRRPTSMEKVLLVKNNERHFYDLMLYPLVTNGIEGTVVRIEDVTEQAQIQELMVQSEKMISLGGLAAGMAHEINNPLGIISQAAQNIERRISPDLPGNQKVAAALGLDLNLLQAYLQQRDIPQFVQDVREASARAARIVGNMLQFSRKGAAIRQLCMLNEILERSIELAASDYDLKKRYDFRSIEIVREYDPDLPAVPVDMIEMEQVFLNLLKNAAQALGENPPERKPQIILRLRREDRYAVAEVQDNGPGMEGGVLRRIFEPFFTTKEPGSGTGLGLSVSYMIVTQNHRGLMTAESSVGNGAQFRVSLPLAQEE